MRRSHLAPKKQIAIFDIWSDFEVWASYAWSISVGTLMFTILTLAAAFMTGEIIVADGGVTIG